MRKRFQMAGAGLMALLAGLALVGFSATGVLAAHPAVPLYDQYNSAITGKADQNPFSFKYSCSSCHESNGMPGYDEIEKGSYHAQLASNQLKGWNNWNIDAYNGGSGDKFKAGPAPKGKNWVQSPGHFGKW